MLIQKAIFFWSEWKPISLYMTSCSDFEVTDVVDSSIGSGAVAICALYNQCHDVGVCYNNPNMVWVRCLLQQCFVVLVSDGKKTKVDGEIVKNNVQRVVLASRQWLPSHSAKEAFDCGLDDSGIEE